MKPGMRMLMMDKVRQTGQRSEYGSDPSRRMIGYDRNDEMPHGGMPYDAMPGPYRSHPPMGTYGGYGMPYDRREDGPESRRRRDRRGRYMMDGMDDDDDDDKYRVKESKHGGAKWEEDDDWCEKLKRTSFKQVDEHQAMEWVSEMQAENGKPMPFFRIEDTENQRKAMCPECDKWEFFVTMNAMYADYQPIGQKYGAGDKPDFYGMMAKLFLCDKDAGRHKLQKYMMAIPK